MSHYVELIKAHGPAAHFSTDQSERMHIQAAKVPYRKSNRRNFMLQIINRLELSERVREHDEYFKWRKIVESSSRDDGFDDACSEGHWDEDEGEVDVDGDTDIEVPDPADDPLDDDDVGGAEPEGAEQQDQDDGMDSQPSAEYGADIGATHSCPTQPFQ